MNELIDGFIDDEEIDFAKQFSVPFPSQVFLTHVRTAARRAPDVPAMKDGVIRPDHVVGHESATPRPRRTSRQTADSIYAYFERVLDEREGERRDDLLSHFLDAEVDGERLTHEEILDICFLFLIAGLDTVSASLDCFFGHLAQHPDARGRIVDEPEAIPSVVEELLRWETPVMAVARVATRDTEVGGCPVNAGEQVMALIGAANVDDAEFPDAGRAAMGPRRQPTPRLRRRHPPVPGVASGAPGAADRAARVAPPDTRLLR